MLWRGIAEIVVRHQLRYLIGCSSLSTASMGEGLAAYRLLTPSHLSPPRFRALPHPTIACTCDEPLQPIFRWERGLLGRQRLTVNLAQLISSRCST
jgi:hypothetical protein